MTVLPIVERELRVAARRRSSYWSRVLAALLAGIVAGGVLAGAQYVRPMGGTQVGLLLFQVLSWVCFLSAACAGVALTADCLSEERRDGTLGLLFLTDLRSIEVVLGKLSATSLQAVYGILAVFPVLALAFLVGGITGAHFWRSLLAIANALFFSLAVGLWVSSLSRDAHKAMNVTLLVCALFTAGLPLLDWSIARWSSGSFIPGVSLASPTHAFLNASWGGGRYATSLGLVHVLAWLALVLAGRHARRLDDDRVASPDRPGSSRAGRWFPGVTARRAARLRRLLEGNPIRWLACRDLWLRQTATLRTGLLAFGAFALLALAAGKLLTAGGMVLQSLCWLLGLVLGLWVASQASRFFVDAIRTGALEQILVTPITVGDLLRGQWWALWRSFLAPLLGILMLRILASGLWAVALVGWSAAPGYPLQGTEHVTFQVVGFGVDMLRLVTRLAALAWFGMWMGVTSRKTLAAVTKTVVFVMILPGLALTVAQVGFEIVALRVYPSIWVWTTLFGILSLGVDLFFILFARRRLLTRLREVVTQAG